MERERRTKEGATFKLHRAHFWRSNVNTTRVPRVHQDIGPSLVSQSLSSKTLCKFTLRLKYSSCLPSHPDERHYMKLQTFRVRNP